AGIAGAGAELRDLRDELSKVAREVKADAVADQTAEARKAALLEGSENASTEAERQRMREQAEEIVILEQFPFAERTQVFTESKDEHHEAAQALKDQLAPAVAALPTSFASEEAGALIERVRKKLPNFLENLDESVAKASEWSYDEPVSFFGSVLKFFFGKEWITNSSWNDFYGLLPLFSGSLLISIIALAVAVPFSIGAAIYVNRLATPAEQNFIKPAIEMIQAIPSVVLGFFGIAVLGEGMRELSQLEYLSWVPGFPMQERLNILTAGLLLALMAVPTVFTLTEDALNNVPRSFSEASLALGASKLQTILKVVLPSAISGILAAVLLGFGRVIGETMVVLLVAGNQIAIPDFSEGLGVVTQPAHTMTGIIAQEMGEVSDGTLHWRALFLVGLVLFTISLLINITAQQVIKRLSRHS
ncbi:MAG: phosphate ABC transporter permease subunit PstC, partial [Verrucomicrobiales bacterium]